MKAHPFVYCLKRKAKVQKHVALHGFEYAVIYYLKVSLLLKNFGCFRAKKSAKTFCNLANYSNSVVLNGFCTLVY